VTLSEPSEDALKKYPDLQPSWCFRFVYHQPGDDLDGFSSVRFCNDTPSKLGNLFLFLCDLAGGQELEECDPEEYVGSWFRIRVRKRKQSDKLHVAGADPIDPPEWADEVESAVKSRPGASSRNRSAKPAATASSAAGPPDEECPI